MSLEQSSIFIRLFKNPIALRELRVAGRSWKIFAALMVSLLLQLAAFGIVVASFAGQTDAYEELGRVSFATQAVILLISVTMIFPAFSCLAIVSEKDKKSFDLLLLSHLGTWEIVWGKLVSAMASAAIFLLASLPFFAVSVLFGGVEADAVIVTLSMLFILSLLISSWGIYASVTMARPVAALIVTYIVSMALGLMGGLTGGAFIAAAFFSPNSDIAAMFAWPADVKLFSIVWLISFVTLIFVQFFLLTVAKLKTPSQNRSFALRVYVVVLTLWWVAMSIAAPFAMEEFPAVVRVITAYVITTMVSMVCVVAVIIAGSGPAFAPRNIRVDLERSEAKGVLGRIKWLFAPGSSAGLLLALILIVPVIFCTGLLADRLAIDDSAPPTRQEMRRDLIMSAELGVSSFEESRIEDFVRHLAGGGSPQGMTDDLRRIDSRFRAEETPPPSTAAATQQLQNHLVEALEVRSGFFWKLLFFYGLIAFSFGGFGWWMGAARKPIKVWAVLIILFLVIWTFVPLILKATLQELFDNEFQTMSPIQIWMDLSLLMTLDQIEVFDITKGQLDTLNEFRSGVWGRLGGHIAFLLGVSALSYGLGWKKRKKMTELLKESGGRWPVPVLPPARILMESRQTHLLPESGVPAHSEPLSAPESLGMAPPPLLESDALDPDTNQDSGGTGTP